MVYRHCWRCYVTIWRSWRCLALRWPGCIGWGLHWMGTLLDHVDVHAHGSCKSYGVSASLALSCITIWKGGAFHGARWGLTGRTRIVPHPPKGGQFMWPLLGSLDPGLMQWSELAEDGDISRPKLASSLTMLTGCSFSKGGTCGPAIHWELMGLGAGRSTLLFLVDRLHFRKGHWLVPAGTTWTSKCDKGWLGDLAYQQLDQPAAECRTSAS